LIGNENIYKQIKEFGDYQTPEYFVEKVCYYINQKLNIKPDIIIEPTFGLGNFVTGSLKSFDSIKKIFGIEINSNYFNFAKNSIDQKINGKKIEIKMFNENIFSFDFESLKESISKKDNLLIIGNPPWVTNSELESLKSYNIPLKDNFKGLKGLDAITGKGNFDIAEYILLQLLSEFKNYDCTIAMLCKNIVARNIVRDLDKYKFKLSEIRMINFDAREVFNVNCDAGLLIMKLGQTSNFICDVYDFKNDSNKIKSFGWVNNNFISDIDKYDIGIDGISQLVWRQGIKHDCSKVMELSLKYNNSFKNGFQEDVEIEDYYIYPLLKSSDLKKTVITKTRKNVIVTQKKVKEETESIKLNSPKLWDYLLSHSKELDNRKSSIYKNSPRFCVFGVGDYSYKPYKVCLSGFYKEPIFALVYNEIKRPVMLDDTCYLLGFDNYKTALITMILLNSTLVYNFLKSIAFLDSKRPYTKDLLMRIDLLNLTKKINFTDFFTIANTLKIENNLIEQDYKDYIKRISSNMEK